MNPLSGDEPVSEEPGGSDFRGVACEEREREDFRGVAYN
jgi:hypothetical protein